MVNWDEVLTSKTNVKRFSQFARGELSGTRLYDFYVNGPLGGVVRDLARRGNVDRGRQRTRQALRRRGVVV